MDKKEIKDYLKRVDKLLDKLKEEDKETLSWLIYGYNQCAKLLNETQKENEKLKADYGTKSQIERDFLKEENQKLKAELQLYKGSLKREHEAIHRVNELEKVIDEAIEYIEKEQITYEHPIEPYQVVEIEDILDILKEVE